MSKQILILDSTQLDAFLTCPQMWKYGHNECLTPAGAVEDTKEAMAMGTYGHKLLEIYYKYMSKGHSQSTALEAMTNFDPDRETCECGHPEEHHNYEYKGYEQLKGHETVPTEFVNTACKTIECTCSDFTPRPFPLGRIERVTVLKRVREYSYTYSHGDFKPHNPDTVEIGFSHNLYESADRLYILEGRIDGLGTLGGQEVWIDHKFQMRKRNLYKKSIQFRNYAMVTGKALGIINYVRFTKEANADTYKRDITSFSTVELDIWKARIINVYHRIADMMQAGEFEKNWSSCSGKFGYPCDFTPLCEEWNNETVANKKTQLYKLRPQWRPW